MSELERYRSRDVQAIQPGDLPGLAKLVATGSLRIGRWAAATGLDAGRRVVDVALHPEHAGDLADDLRVAAAAVTRALVGDDVQEQVREQVRAAATTNPVVRVVTDAVETVAPPRPPVAPAEPPLSLLQQAGEELMRRSRDVWYDDTSHPAYAQILTQLAPDEGRILALLVRTGPQPTVDVRTGGLVGTVSSTLVKANLNMIGARAGCRHVDRVPSYLHNLERLGLIWFSQETLRDPMEYQIVEAQPDVLEAMHSVRKAKVVRRSIHLTPFGEDFCREGLGLRLTQEQLDSLPEHSSPAEARKD